MRGAAEKISKGHEETAWCFLQHLYNIQKSLLELEKNAMRKMQIISRREKSQKNKIEEDGNQKKEKELRDKNHLKERSQKNNDKDKNKDKEEDKDKEQKDIESVRNISPNTMKSKMGPGGIRVISLLIPSNDTDSIKQSYHTKPSTFLISQDNQTIDSTSEKIDSGFDFESIFPDPVSSFSSVSSSTLSSVPLPLLSSPPLLSSSLNLLPSPNPTSPRSTPTNIPSFNPSSPRTTPKYSPSNRFKNNVQSNKPSFVPRSSTPQKNINLTPQKIMKTSSNVLSPDSTVDLNNDIADKNVKDKSPRISIYNRPIFIDVTKRDFVFNNYSYDDTNDNSSNNNSHENSPSMMRKKKNHIDSSTEKKKEMVNQFNYRNNNNDVIKIDNKFNTNNKNSPRNDNIINNKKNDKNIVKSNSSPSTPTSVYSPRSNATGKSPNKLLFSNVNNRLDNKVEKIDKNDKNDKKKSVKKIDKIGKSEESRKIEKNGKIFKSEESECNAKKKIRETINNQIKEMKEKKDKKEKKLYDYENVYYNNIDTMKCNNPMHHIDNEVEKDIEKDIHDLLDENDNIPHTITSLSLLGLHNNVPNYQNKIPNKETFTSTSRNSSPNRYEENYQKRIIKKENDDEHVHLIESNKNLVIEKERYEKEEEWQKEKENQKEKLKKIKDVNMTTASTFHYESHNVLKLGKCDGEDGEDVRKLIQLWLINLGVTSAENDPQVGRGLSPVRYSPRRSNGSVKVMEKEKEKEKGKEKEKEKERTNENKEGKKEKEKDERGYNKSDYRESIGLHHSSVEHDIDLNNEWSNGVLLSELCAALNPLLKEEYKEVGMYDCRGQLINFRLVLTGSELNVRSRAQVKCLFFSFFVLFFI